MFKKGTFANNFMVLFSGNTISQIVPFIFWPIITRLFLKEDLAVQANFVALAGMISIAAGGRYETAIVLPAEKKKAMNLFSISAWLTIIVSGLSVLFYFFRVQVDSFYEKGELSEYLILIAVAIPLYSFTNIFTQWLIREKKYRALTSSGIARSAFVSLFTILFGVGFGYGNYGVLGLILGTIVGYAIALVMMYLSSQSTLDFTLVNRQEKKLLIREYRDFPLINAPHAFTDILFTKFIIYAIITKEFGLEALAFFSIMSTLLSGSMKAIGGAVGQLYYKEASDKIANHENVSVVLFRSIKLMSVFAIPACLFVLFFGPEIFGWFLGEDFSTAGEFAQIMIIPFFINFLTSPISATPIIYRKQSWAFVFSLIGYSTGIAAFLIGNYLKFDFFDTLIIYAGTQTVYYLWLLGWYMKLTRQRV